MPFAGPDPAVVRQLDPGGRGAPRVRASLSNRAATVLTAPAWLSLGTMASTAVGVPARTTRDASSSSFGELSSRSRRASATPELAALSAPTTATLLRSLKTSRAGHERLLAWCTSSLERPMGRLWSAQPKTPGRSDDLRSGRLPMSLDDAPADRLCPWSRGMVTASIAVGPANRWC